MVMSPEERRRRMHKARGRSRRVSGETDAKSGDYFDYINASRDAESSAEDRTGEQLNGDCQADNDPGRQTGSGSGEKKKRRRQKKSGTSRLIIAAAALFVAVIVAVTGIRALSGLIDIGKTDLSSNTEGAVTVQDNGISGGQEGDQSDSTQDQSEADSADRTMELLDEARLLAAQYDYDGAIELARSVEGYDSNAEAMELVSLCEETKATLVEQNINEITHIFFHILCVDPENSFDESRWGRQAGGYNSLMTTVDEFNKMMQELYDKGYVLVSIRDLAEEVTNADGTVSMKKGSIMLPPGKKAFVMSEDDVCYYEYMKGAGYADKIIVGEDGKPLVHYTDSEGNEHTGAYDVVGCLDAFIDEHPDFSYRGHKACLVFTGYNGILGYRTDESYDPSSEYYDPSLEQGHDVEAERKQAVEVLKALAADGYDLGSHSWGHRDLGEIDMDRFKKDCDRWNRNVAPLIKEATGRQPDIIIYPKGADVADWHGYDHSNQRFDYLWDLGFRYFCNVDSSQYWVQLGDDYLRQGRRALDGYNMWNDIANGYNRLGDLFDNVSEIFDPARPTPVPTY